MRSETIPPAADARTTWWAGGCIAALFLAASAASIVVVGHLKAAYLAGTTRPIGLLRQLGPADLALDVGLLALVGLLVLAVAALEWRARGLRRLVMAERPAALGLAVAAAVLWFAHATLAPGLLVVGDAGSHVTRVSHLMAALRGDGSLYWDNDYFGGGTLLQFTGPVFHWLASLAGLLLGDATAGIKAVVLLGRLLCAAMMWGFLRRLGCRQPAAMLGGLFYAGDFLQTYFMSVRGTFPQIVNLAALPAILLCLEALLARPVLLSAAGAGLCLAATLMIGNHQPTVLVACVFLALYAAVRLSMLGWTRRRLAVLLTACAVIAVAAVFFVLPFVAEKAWTAEDFSVRILHLRRPDIADFLIWGRAGTGASYAAYLGLSVLLVACAGCLAVRRRLPGQRSGLILWATFLALAGLSLVLTGSYVRETVFTLLFLAAAAAMSLELLQRAFPDFAIPAVAAAVFLLDCGPAAVQPWTRPDLRPQVAASHELARRATDQRVLEISLDKAGTPSASVGPNGSPLFYDHVPMLYGPHKMDATRAHNAMVAVIKLAEADLARGGGAGGVLGPDSAGLLAFYDVGWLVGHGPVRMGLPAGWPGLDDPVLGHYARLPGATPFVTAARLEQVARPAAFDGYPLWKEDFDDADSPGRTAEQADIGLWRQMEVSLPTSQAARLLLPVLPSWSEPAAGLAPVARLVEHRIDPGVIRLVVEADRPGFIRLAHPWYPARQVRLNGQPVEAVSDVFSMLVTRLPAGRSEFVLTVRPSLLRRTCFAVTAVALVTLLLGLLVGLLAGLARPMRR